MSLVYARLQDLPLHERLIRMRHYCKVPVYLARQFARHPLRGFGSAMNRAKDEAELKMNLLHDWSDLYPKG